jgi:hypothetical protein
VPPKNVLAKEPDPEEQHRRSLTRSLIEVVLMVAVAMGWLSYTQTMGRAQQDRQFQEQM